MSAAEGAPALVTPTPGACAIGADERGRLLAPLADHPAVLIAVSGGPDSTVLAFLAAQWRAARADGPRLFVATVDHALRPGSAAEAEGVGRLCASLGLPHRILTWQGEKPTAGVQAAARSARYALLAAAARAEGATAIAVAHTLDDQAETVLFRLARGSGVRGLAAMRAVSRREGLVLLRPLLEVPKARLEATAAAAGLSFVRDPSNTDPRFARARLRRLAPLLAEEGLDAARLGAVARRMARLDAAAEAATDDAFAAYVKVDERGEAGPRGERVRIAALPFAGLPEEIALRLMARAVARVGCEGPAELGKLEDLTAMVRAHLAAPPPRGPFRRTLAGALVAVRQGEVIVTIAPPRRHSAAVK